MKKANIKQDLTNQKIIINDMKLIAKYNNDIYQF